VKDLASATIKITVKVVQGTLDVFLKHVLYFCIMVRVEGLFVCHLRLLRSAIRFLDVSSVIFSMCIPFSPYCTSSRLHDIVVAIFA